MSGGSVPYHLRANKAVDRQLFIETLSMIQRVSELTDYAYATLGGPYLEDLKLLHNFFGITKLLSFESDDIVYKRQEFNRPISLIQCFNYDSSDFITYFDEYCTLFDTNRWIVWLDYASPKHRDSQLGELSALVQKLGAGDIFKITMNASVHTLAERGNYSSHDQFQEAAYENLESQLGDYFPAGFSPRDMKSHGMARILTKAIQHSVMLATKGIKLAVQPLTAFRYSDSTHQMLTLAAVVLPQGEEKQFLDVTQIGSWDMATVNWGDVKEIYVPDLSLKEKMKVDELLFSGTIESIHQQLPFKFDKSPQRSLDILEHYMAHYRRYPSFMRVLA